MTHPAAPETVSAPPVLTNLAHLDLLRDSVAPPDLPGHTTYRLAQRPDVGVVWTYAERRPDGGYRRVGGGAFDPVTCRYRQGAFNADDIARAAVVYLRHWRAAGALGGSAADGRTAGESRAAAFQLLRGLAYLQTVHGPHAGNVVLWMQPDGTLNPSAEPVEYPDPSDSAESCWLARTVWALGEGYAAFRDDDPGFAAFLRSRLTLAVAAIERQCLARYGRWSRIDGVRVPTWLITDGADATGEALLGLARYVTASGDAHARGVLARLAEGVAAMAAGSPGRWPYGAVMPSARSPRVWRAWGGLAPAGLARAYAVTGDRALRDAALSDVAVFTPRLLVTGGPQNARTPGAADPVQIAYGAQSRIESLLTASECLDRPGLAALAGVAAGWFFGDNPAGEPVYDPATGVTFDGIDPPGVVHRDAGAESTIHGLLAMLALDGCPEAAEIAHAGGAGTTLVCGGATAPRRVAVPVGGEGPIMVRVGGEGPVTVRVFDGTGRECAGYRHAPAAPPGATGSIGATGVTDAVGVVEVAVPGGGFALVQGGRPPATG